MSLIRHAISGAAFAVRHIHKNVVRREQRRRQEPPLRDCALGGYIDPERRSGLAPGAVIATNRRYRLAEDRNYHLLVCFACNY